ncbi:MAG: hypothetical protein R2789_03570 [Microthrixaceae bacterium]
MLETRLLRIEPADELTQAHTPEELGAMLDEAAPEANWMQPRRVASRGHCRSADSLWQT